MQIIRNYPPNFRKIAEAFPQARKPGVIFSYGDKIYAPTTNKISEHLIVHEQVHGKRQLQVGVEYWWHMYITNRAFRYNEELLAHRAEFRSLVGSGMPEAQALKNTATRLSSKLYGGLGGFEQAKKDILAAA